MVEGRVSADNSLFVLAHPRIFYVDKDSDKSIRHEERAYESNKVKKTEPRKERGYRLRRDKLSSEYGYLVVRSVVMVMREMEWTLVETQ